MSKNSNDENIRALNALATVSSLAVMIVVDFLLAFYGGDWLDNYFQTGDHSCRLFCICLAILTVFMTFYRLVATVIHRDD